MDVLEDMAEERMRWIGSYATPEVATASGTLGVGEYLDAGLSRRGLPAFIVRIHDQAKATANIVGDLVRTDDPTAIIGKTLVLTTGGTRYFHEFLADDGTVTRVETTEDSLTRLRTVSGEPPPAMRAP